MQEEGKDGLRRGSTCEQRPKERRVTEGQGWSSGSSGVWVERLIVREEA